MNVVRKCQVVYVKTDDGVQGQSTNYDLGTHTADTKEELIEIFRNKCSELLCVNADFISIQLSIVKLL
jgi:hypothetical protein